MTPHQPVIVILVPLSQAADPRSYSSVCLQSDSESVRCCETLRWVTRARGSGRERGAVSVTTRMPGVFDSTVCGGAALCGKQCGYSGSGYDSTQWFSTLSSIIVQVERKTSAPSGVWTTFRMLGLKRLNGLTSWSLVKWLSCDKITAQCADRKTQHVHNRRSFFSSKSNRVPHLKPPRGAWAPHWSSA